MTETHGNLEPLEGIYSTSTPNEEIVLSREEVEVSVGDLQAVCDAEVALEFLPSPLLVVRIEGTALGGPLSRAFRTGPIVVSFTRSGVSTEVGVQRMRAGSFSFNRFEATVVPKESLVRTSPVTEMTRVVFHVVNFPHCRVSDRKRGRSVSPSQLVLSDNRWRITLDSARTTGDIVSSLQEEGGYAITHVGRIERGDGSSFSSEEVCHLLDRLLLFLSFARGLWAPPILPVGFDAGGRRVWEEWGVRPAEPWKPVLSWFDSNRGYALVQAFPGFSRASQDPTWKAAVRRAIYWYVMSNAGASGMESSIILTQAALELLSWVSLTEDSQSLSKQGFKALSASDQLSLLFSRIGIPLEIPSDLSELPKVAKEFNYDNAPQAFTRVRNSIVHPGHKQQTKLSNAIYDAWALGLWYTELFLLHLFDYHGDYSNRLNAKWKGQVEPVPWKARFQQGDAATP